MFRLVRCLRTGNFFGVMGLGREIGRVFDSGDDGEAAAPVVVLTYDRLAFGFRAIVASRLTLSP